MKELQRCLLCRGPVEPDREVEEVVREGNDVVVVRVRADVCKNCHEAFLYPGMVDRMHEAKAALRSGKAGAAAVVGRVYAFDAVGR